MRREATGKSAGCTFLLLTRVNTHTHTDSGVSFTAATVVGRFQTLLQRVLSHLTSCTTTKPWLGPQGRRIHLLLGIRLSCEPSLTFPQGDSSMENSDRFMPGSRPVGVVLLSDPGPSTSYLLEQES